MSESNEFKRTTTQTITTKWWCDDDVEMKDYFESQLNEHADNHIQDMIADGYTSGDLYHVISGDDVDFRGWWEIETIEV